MPKPNSVLINRMIGKDIANGLKLLGIDPMRTPPKVRIWTKDSDNILIFYYKKGYTVNLIAEEIGREEYDIVGRIWYLGEEGKLKKEDWNTRGDSKASGPCDYKRRGKSESGGYCP